MRVTKTPPTDCKVFAWTVIADSMGVTGGPRLSLVSNPSGLIPHGPNCALVVYMGHVRVTVQGQVNAGDVLCASEERNGFAVSAGANGGASRIGVALMPSANGMADALVWIMRGDNDPSLAALPAQVNTLSVKLEGHERQLEMTAAELTKQVSRIDVLEHKTADMEERFMSLSLGDQSRVDDINVKVSALIEKLDIRDKGPSDDQLQSALQSFVNGQLAKEYDEILGLRLFSQPGVK
jgi:hypothetical protein